MSNDAATIVAENGHGRYQQEIRTGRHRLLADEPETAGGGDAGPTPYDLLAAALGACTSMTLRMYAERKGLPLDRVAVEVRHAKIDGVDVFSRAIRLDAELPDAVRARMLEIANRCPVYRTLSGGAKIATLLTENAHG